MNPTNMYCTNCEAFIDHTTPVNTGHATTGDSGCPECLTASVKRVVVSKDDERDIQNAYIGAQTETITLEAARGEA